MMKDAAVPLAYIVRVLQWLYLWPDKDHVSLLYFLKNLTFYSHAYFAVFTTATASIRQIMVGIDDSSALVDSSIGTIDVSGFIYMNICLFFNISKIKHVARGIGSFRKFCPVEVVTKSEARIKKYSKAIFAYCIVGNSINASLAMYDSPNCVRPNQLLYERDPCGYPSRCYFPMDVSGPRLYWTMFVMQTWTCLMVSLGVLSITMLIVGILIHTIEQLKYCSKILSECNLDRKLPPKVLQHSISNIIEYHTMIIECSQITNVACGTIMLFHLTVTSLIISVLGFNIVTVQNISNCLRFGLHLIGWIVLLFLICYYGQQLNDESVNIAVAAYSVEWFEAPISVQMDLRLIIARAQRPLVLTALNLDVMSLNTFVKVIKTAYSYFALFLNLKF